MYRISYQTSYKVGDILYGQNSMNLKVIKINSNNTIDFEFLPPRSGSMYYYLEGKEYKYYKYQRDDSGIPIRPGDPGYNQYPAKQVSYGQDYDYKEPYMEGSNHKDVFPGWKNMPSDRKIRGIDPRCTHIHLSLWYDTKQTMDKSVNWWGNYYADDYYGAVPRIVYGDPPYGIYYIPQDTNKTVPDKDLPEAEWKEFFGVGNEWNRVAGSYKWEKSGNFGDFYGWTRKDNYGPYLNRYQKKCVMKYEKGVSGLLDSGLIALTNLKEVVTNIDDPNMKPYTPKDVGPIRLFCHRGKGTGAMSTYDEIIKNKTLMEMKAKPATNKFSDYLEVSEVIATDDNGEPLLDPNGKPIKKLVISSNRSVLALLPTCKDTLLFDNPNGNDSEKTFKQYRFRNTETDNWSAWRDLPSEISYTIGQNLNSFLGYYEVKIRGRYKDAYRTINGTVLEYNYIYREGNFQFSIQDNNPVIKPTIVEYLDKNNPVYQYDMTKDITDGTRQPSWKAEIGHTYYGYYDFYEYENEGYDVKLRNAKVPLNLSYDNAGTCYVTDMFREDGQYYLHITANYRGLRQTYEEALFLIDKRRPGLPIINVNGRDYEGPLADTTYDTHINSVIVNISYPPFCVPNNFKVEYKRFNFDSWTTISGILGQQVRSDIINPEEGDDIVLSASNYSLNNSSIILADSELPDTPNSNELISTDDRFNIFNRIGTYRITVRSRKTTLSKENTAPKYQPYISDQYNISNGYSEAIFKVKRKFTYAINLDTDEPAYRVKAYIDFANPIDTNIDSSSFTDGTIFEKKPSELTKEELASLKWGDGCQYTTEVTTIDPNTGESIVSTKIVTQTWTGSEWVQDYGNVDLYINKLYRINGGNWKYYLGPVYIYDNCIIECKSVDEDGFESYITRKEITNIDKSTPSDPIVKYDYGDTSTAVSLVSGETFNDNILFSIE